MRLFHSGTVILLVLCIYSKYDFERLDIQTVTLGLRMNMFYYFTNTVF